MLPTAIGSYLAAERAADLAAAAAHARRQRRRRRGTWRTSHRGVRVVIGLRLVSRLLGAEGQVR